jgi:hypothetical protein
VTSPAFPLPPDPRMPPLPGGMPFPGPATPAADETVPGQGEALEPRAPDPRWKLDFHGLLYLGALRASFRYLGHRISIRTLTSYEELVAAQLSKEWAETLGGTRAHAIAVVCLCVDSVDHQAMPTPLGEESATNTGWADERFRYASRWYPYTIDEIFSRYLELEGRARAVIEELGKGSAPPESGPESAGTSGSLPAEDS